MPGTGSVANNVRSISQAKIFNKHILTTYNVILSYANNLNSRVVQPKLVNIGDLIIRIQADALGLNLIAHNFTVLNHSDND